MATYYKQKGVGLLEVLIAVLVLSVSLLAIASMQSRSLHYNQSAYVRSQVNIFASDIFERIRANRPNLSQYSLAYGAAAPSGAAISSVDMREWLENLKRVLPEAEASITCTAIGATTLHKCDASIRWEEGNISGEDCSQADSERCPNFTYTTSI